MRREGAENAGSARGWRARRSQGKPGEGRKKPPRVSRKRVTREKNIRMAMRQKGLV